MPKQQTLKDSEKQLVALGRTLQILREEDNVDVLIETTINYIQAEFDYSLIWIGLYDRLEHRLYGKGGKLPQQAKSPNEQSLLKQKFPLNPGDIFEQVVIQQRPVGVPDLREERRAGEWRRIATNFQIQGTMLFPLRYRALCFGIAILGSGLWGISPRAEDKARLSMIFGELAASLNQIEANWHRQQTKRPDEPLLSLLAKLRSLGDLRLRLDSVVSQTHEFVKPNRTNIYWFEKERRYFWRRASNQSRTSGGLTAQSASGITVQEVSSFYKALVADQLVSIGEAHSSLKADTTSRLMQQIKARSLLAAPIIYQEELLGFLAVEGNEARIWEEAEKNYVRGAAQLIAMCVPLEEMEETVERAKKDQALTAQIVHGIYSEQDWKTTLDNCAQLLCDRLGVERFLVLLYNKEHQYFDIACQNQPANRRPLVTPLELPSDVDWKLLEDAQQAIPIENWDEDMKLLAWRLQFLEVGIRSLIVCNTSIGQPIEGLIVIGHEVPRTWDTHERELVLVVSQQIGLIIHQWQLHHSMSQTQKIHSMIQWGLTTLQQVDRLLPLETESLQQIAQVLQVPLAVMVTWSLQQNENSTFRIRAATLQGRITASIITSEELAIDKDAIINVQSDPLIQLAIANDGLLQVNGDRLSPQTRTWLKGDGIGEILVMVLRTAPEHEPTGIVLVADYWGRTWSQKYLDALGILVSQLAWSRRNLALTGYFESQREELERLNWYKQRRIEEIYRTIGTEVKKLNNLGTPKDALTLTRYQQGLRAVSTTVSSMTQILKEEQWQLHYKMATIPLVSLLRRALQRVDNLIKQRELFVRVQSDTGAIQASGDIVKIELILYELLVAACQRSTAKGRIDIWCRPSDGKETDSLDLAIENRGGYPTNSQKVIDLSITDAGVIDPRLVCELQSSQSFDLLAPSTLDRPPGLNLRICQSLIRRMGGDFSIYKLDDGRILSRLLLPIK